MRWTTLIVDDELVKDIKNFIQKKILSKAMFEELQKQDKISKEEVLFLTGNQSVIFFANSMKIPVVGFETADIKLKDVSYILQAIEEDCQDFLQKVYNRYYHLPVFVLETKHCYIREMLEADTENLYQLYHFPDVQTEVFESSFNKEELKQFVKSYRDFRYPFYNYGMWIVEQKGTRAFIGEIGIEEDSHEQTEKFCLEAGYAICPQMRRKGYAKEVLQAVIQFAREAKEEFGFEGINCYIDEKNIPSIKTAKRCGFTEQSTEGIFMKDVWRKKYHLLL